MPANDDAPAYSYFAAHQAKCKEIDDLRAQLAAAVAAKEKAERERDELNKRAEAALLAVRAKKGEGENADAARA